MQQITILIVDDHAVFRRVCSDMLQENKLFLVLACTGDAEEALRITKEAAPQIILVDISMPVSGFELTRRIKQINSDTKIIGLSLHAGIHVAQKLVDCGGSGYLTKSSSIDELSDAIIRVHKGEIYFSRENQ